MKNPTYLKFHLLLITLVLCMSGTTWAGTAYVANEGSATVSVIDTATNFIVATIGLGSDPAIAGTPRRTAPTMARPTTTRPSTTAMPTPMAYG